MISSCTVQRAAPSRVSSRASNGRARGVATVKRDGHQYQMTFKQGKPTGSLKKVGAARGSGTTVYFKPDPQIFPTVEFDAAIIRERLRSAQT